MIEIDNDYKYRALFILGVGLSGKLNSLIAFSANVVSELLMFMCPIYERVSGKSWEEICL